MGKSKQKAIRFEQAIEELEELIDRIESGEVGLEESLAQYEQGMKLIVQCKQILSKAEKKIAKLTLDNKGHLKLPDSGARD